MVAVDGTGIPLTILTESANISEFKLALETLDQISVESRPGHPHKRPATLIADRGYDAKWLRTEIRRRNITPYIPKRRTRGQDEQPAYNTKIKDKYATRWIVERTNAWLQNYRRIVVRWDRNCENYEAFIEIACILICLRRV